MTLLRNDDEIVNPWILQANLRRVLELIIQLLRGGLPEHNLKGLCNMYSFETRKHMECIKF